MRKVPLMVYFEPDQHARIKAVAERMRVPFAVLVREGLDLVLDQAERVVERHDDEGGALLFTFPPNRAAQAKEGSSSP